MFVSKVRRLSDEQLEAIMGRYDQLRAKIGFKDDAAFAAIAGLDKSQISRIRSKERGLSIPTLQKMAKFLGVSVDYLLTGEGDEPQRPVFYVLDGSSMQTLRDALDIALRQTKASEEAQNAPLGPSDDAD
jgi:transcriptional regulator with XRE-family HTH domain